MIENGLSHHVLNNSFSPHSQRLCEVCPNRWTTHTNALLIGIERNEDSHHQLFCASPLPPSAPYMDMDARRGFLWFASASVRHRSARPKSRRLAVIGRPRSCAIRMVQSGRHFQMSTGHRSPVVQFKFSCFLFKEFLMFGLPVWLTQRKVPFALFGSSPFHPQHPSVRHPQVPLHLGDRDRQK